MVWDSTWEYRNLGSCLGSGEPLCLRASVSFFMKRERVDYGLLSSYLFIAQDLISFMLGGVKEWHLDLK